MGRTGTASAARHHGMTSSAGSKCPRHLLWAGDKGAAPPHPECTRPCSWDAHSESPRDYVQNCLEELERTEADNVDGTWQAIPAKLYFGGDPRPFPSPDPR